MKPFIPLLLIILLIAGPLVAESTWEGTTAVSRYGEFPESGNYGASNSFSRNTIITVTNMESGQSTTVIIVDRLDDPGLFLLLSTDAASELGVARGEIVRVRAQLDQPITASNVFREDLPFNPDPDINPAAAVSETPGMTGTSLATLEEITSQLDQDTADTDAAEVVTADTDAAEVDTADTDAAEVDTADTDAAEADTADTDSAEVDTADTDTAEADTADTDAAEADTADTDSEEVADATEVADAAEADATDVAEPPRPTEIEDAEPSIKEDSVVAQAPDEPTPPRDASDNAEVTSLTSTDGEVEDHGVVVDTPPVPVVDGTATPSMLGLLPAPILDEEELFVLLAKPDVPDVSEFVPAEPEQDMLISSLVGPPIMAEDRLSNVLPPEPVFDERMAQEFLAEDPPVVEDILIVSELITPEESADLMAGMPSWTELPVVVHKEEDIPVITLLNEPPATESTAPSAVAVAEPMPPEVVIEGDEIRVSHIDTPPADVLAGESLDEVNLDEPIFAVADIEPTQPEELLIVSNLFGLPEVAEADTDVDIATVGVAVPEVVDATPTVVNGFEPPEYDPDEFELVLEPAEPRPPEPIISEMLVMAEGEEVVETLAAAAEPDVVQAEIGDVAVVDTAVVDTADTSTADTTQIDEPFVDTAVVDADLVNATVDDTTDIYTTGVDEPFIDTAAVDADFVVTTVGDTTDIDTTGVDEPFIDTAAVDTAAVDINTADVEEIAVSKELTVDAFYLQVGVFAESASAGRLQDDLSETYPVTVYLVEQRERPIYKVLVGPLNRDESGALLLTFRSLGFADAFIRKGSVN